MNIIYIILFLGFFVFLVFFAGAMVDHSLSFLSRKFFNRKTSKTNLYQTPDILNFVQGSTPGEISFVCWKEQEVDDDDFLVDNEPSEKISQDELQQVREVMCDCIKSILHPPSSF